jgi:hypothetical protein
MVLILATAGCAGSSVCDADKANNKLLALGSIQTRLVAKGGESGRLLALKIAQDSAPVAELIAQKKYAEACAKADELASQLGIKDLERQESDMLTAQQLRKDGGKGSGSCSVADAAKKQMEVHSLLQAEVNAGRRSPDVFRDFNKETAGYAELLSKNPSEACALMDRVKAKYRL